MIRGFNGSTLVALELATALKKLGAKVEVYTCDFAKPASIYFEKAGIDVTTFKDELDYNLSDFDYVWVHSQILPISLVKKMSTEDTKNLPMFIFLHMSGMDWVPDEKPWIYDLENRLSNLSLFISEEVSDINRPLLDDNIPTAFFRNPAPKKYFKAKAPCSRSLRKLLIVSNHPPKEVVEARKILNEKYGVEVCLLGEERGDKYTLLTPSLLKEYDAVLTIAKTVPYCLASNTPVYVYDAYGGGPGWLTEKNFNNAKYRNFSGYQNSFFPNYEGKGFRFKSAQQIAKEITSGYKDAAAFQTSHYNSFVQDFSLETVLPKILKNTAQREIKPLTHAYAESVIASQRFAAGRFESAGLLYERDDNIRSLLADIDKLSSSKAEIDRLSALNAALEEYKKSAESILTSRSYRTFDKLITPYKKIKSKVRRKQS